MGERIIIDAENCILGRLSTKVAELAKLGNEVIIVNCDKAVISGSKKEVIQSYLTKLHRGSTEKGPFQPKRADKFVRRTIRGMMDYKGFKGKPAFARVKTFVGIPEEYAGKIDTSYNFKKSEDLEKYKFTKVEDVCKELGGKW